MTRQGMRQTRRITTRLRIEAGEYVPSEGETVLMERALTGRAVAVTVHRIKQKMEHPKEPGVWLLDATVTMRDIASGASGAWLTHSADEQTTAEQAASESEAETR